MQHVAARRRTSLVVLVGLVAATSASLTAATESRALTAAGTSAATASAAPAGGTKSFSYAGRRITTFYPANFADPAITRILFVGLTRLDARTNRPVTAVASAVTTKNNRVWTINLKRGWTFSNGEPITASTFANSWNFTAYGPNAQGAGGLLNVIQGYDKLIGEKPASKKLSGVKVVDRSTLRVTLVRPFVLFRYLLATEPYLPLPKTAITNKKAWEANPVGNGPYRVAGRFRTGATTVNFDRWSGYKGTAGKADRIVYRTFVEWGGNTVYNAVRAGQVDAAFLIGGQALASAIRSVPQQVLRFNANAVLYLGFPTWDERFKNKSVRQAFSLAIDRAAIVRSLASGIGAAANGLVPPSVAGAAGASCSVCGYDPARARTLLQQGGGFRGSLTLWTYNDDPVNTQVIQAIANQWRNNLGIQDVKLQAIPVGQLYPKLFSKEVDGPVYLYQGGVYPHVYTVAQQLLAKGGLGNVVAYDSPDVNSLLAQAGAAKTAQSAVSLTQQAVRTALADAQIMPVYWPGGGLIGSKKVSGIRTAPPYSNVDLEAVTVK